MRTEYTANLSLVPMATPSAIMAKAAAIMAMDKPFAFRLAELLELGATNKGRV